MAVNTFCSNTGIGNRESAAGLLARGSSDELIANGSAARASSIGLRTFSEDGLLTRLLAQASCDALVASSGADADDVAHEFHLLSAAGLLTGPSAQANFDALKASGVNLFVVAEGFLRLSGTSLLTDPSAIGNRDALVASGENALTVAEGLHLLSKAGLLTGPSAQANRDALVASGENAADVVEGLFLLSEAGLLTDSSAQTHFDALIASGADARAVAERRIEFERLVQECERDDSLESLLEIIQSAQAAKDLFEEAGAAHPNLSISLPAIGKDELPDGDCNNYSGAIRIRKNIPFREKIGILIMELANLCNASSFRAIDQKVLDGEIVDADTYAEAKERIEHENCQRTCKTAQACIETAGWDPAIDFLKEFRDVPFAKYYAVQQRSGHTACYREQFHKIKSAHLTVKRNRPSHESFGAKEPHRKRSKRTAPP